MTRRLRIAYIVPVFSSDADVWSIPVQHHLVRRLSERCDVEVFPLRYPLTQEPYPFYSAKVFPQGAGLVRGWRRIPLLHRVHHLLEERHAIQPYDIAQAMWADEPGYLATRFARRADIPSVVHVLGGELVNFQDIEYGGMRGRLGPRLIPRALKRASVVVAGSKYQDQLVRKFVPHLQCEIRPLGVDIDLFRQPDFRPQTESNEAKPHPPKTLPGAPSLLFVASLVPVKQPLFLAAALREIVKQEPNAHLHIVGEGYLRGRIEQELRDFDLTENRTFHGSVPHDKLPAFYAGADVSVLCSRHEGQGLCVLESGACGTVTVGTPVGILPELPECVTVARDHPAAFAEAVLSLVRDPEDLKQREIALRERIERVHSIDHTVGDLISLYEELCG